jgi:hypothetical protein
MVGQRDLPFEPRRQIRIFKPSALHTNLWCWAHAAAWLNEAVRSHRTGMPNKFRPRKCRSPTCTWQPSYCETRHEARSWWDHGKCILGCEQTEHTPRKKARHDTPNSPTDHGPSTTLPDTPETVKKSKVMLEDNTRHPTLEELKTEVRRLQNRLSESNVQLRKVLDVIQDADDNAAKSPETARSLLNHVRHETAKLRGSRDGAMPSVTVLSLEDFFAGKDDTDVSTMLISLLHELSSTSKASPHNTASTLLRYLQAREKAEDLMASAFKDEIIPCAPLDNLVNTLVDHPNRRCQKWRLEFARLCDLSRVLTLPRGVSSMT